MSRKIIEEIGIKEGKVYKNWESWRGNNRYRRRKNNLTKKASTDTCAQYIWRKKHGWLTVNLIWLRLGGNAKQRYNRLQTDQHRGEGEKEVKTDVLRCSEIQILESKYDAFNLQRKVKNAAGLLLLKNLDIWLMLMEIQLLIKTCWSVT